ncbi:hypothetical protein BU24DRAFT_104107 [Aaosphaeria arxii CBS 175.79]|uniref:LYC1 C-terminal domain-containing protein n=1 Tax=Aaosphaeria arxii CBS 175.79 TaxID=1450172 RepID=A0A6A5XZV5_9PLEO|nr:uncharacterized protein BU24DRAFT_104107 [Aaosphaeria arxii CBS 175.79]KAF2018742.1 hypothetical protein BU24DRAFT_104107 [Aaosphaeria arxii CBS 175.79]
MGSVVDPPHGTSPTLALVHPTEEEKLIQLNLNGSEWKGALSLPVYLRREEVLSSQALTRDGGITYWILVDQDAKSNPLDPTSSARLPLASCETLRKKALVWQDGKTQETITHGIGSVFCAPHLRGRKYAQRMMQELGKVLQTHQTSEKHECLFSILFSDIGKKFYADYGWEPFSSSHISIPGVPSPSVDPTGLPKAKPLHEGDLEELCKLDEALLRKSFQARPKGSPTAVALLPDIDTIRWHHARENFVGTELHGKAPQIKGAMVGSEVGKRVWCYWTRMWYNSNASEAKGNTLHILRVVIEDQESQAPTEETVAALASLLSMAQHQAEEWKAEEVEAWNPSPALVQAAQRLDSSAKLIHRDRESIASLMWYPEHEGPISEKIDWVGNEKYGWC